MFADTLLRAEQMHLFRLLVWGGASIIAGTLVFVVVAWRRSATPLLRQFGLQMAVWGGLEVAYVAATWNRVGLRDVSGATHLDRLLWFNLGLDVGVVAVGLGLVMAGWRMGRRLTAIGAGIGVTLQGAALFLINAQLAAIISR